MKKLSILFALFTSILMNAQNSLEVNIRGLESNEGKVMVALLNESGKTIKSQQVQIKNNNGVFKVDDLKPGVYAVKYYHDENNNGELDTGMFGIPKEGYGFSNDARGMMGPPDFKDMLFKINDDTQLTLNTVNGF